MSLSPLAMIPGLVSVTFRSLPPEQIIALTTQSGLCAIEWGGDIHCPHGDCVRARQVRNCTVDAGLQVAAYGSYYRAGCTGANAGDSPDFAAVLKSAVALGAPTIRVWAGNQASTGLDANARTAIIQDLCRIAILAASEGITIATEFHAFTLTDTSAGTLRMLQEAAHPNLQTLWQPHNSESNATALDGLHTLLPYIGNVHVFQRWPTVADCQLLAHGTERWRPFLDALLHAPALTTHPRFALIEFVKDDSVANFFADAATLRHWLGLA